MSNMSNKMSKPRLLLEDFAPGQQLITLLSTALGFLGRTWRDDEVDALVVVELGDAVDMSFDAIAAVSMPDYVGILRVLDVVREQVLVEHRAGGDPVPRQLRMTLQAQEHVHVDAGIEAGTENALSGEIQEPVSDATS